jgi:DNA polymerase-3 subunit epsilon
MTHSDPTFGPSFTAIDFETANSNRASICAVGMAKVQSGTIVETYSQLVSPPPGYEQFDPRNVQVHGITAETVADAPDWGSVHAAVMAFAESDPLVAHNASFDNSVMNQACSVLDIDWPENPWFDTLAIARNALTLSTYSLPFVTEALNLPKFVHHNAEADAIQAARIAVELCHRTGVDTLEALSAEAIGKASRETAQRPRGDFSQLSAGMPLAGEFIAFTGKLRTTTREEALALVAQLGGTGQTDVTKRTTIVVTGDFDPSTFRPGAKLSTKLEKAQKLVATGQKLEILTEIDLHEKISITREEIETATRAQRTAGRTSWLPAHVVEQAQRIANVELDHSAWLRQALAHPEGRAGEQDPCIRCTARIPANTYWLFRERHVCSGDCNESLKRVAKRAWSKANVRRPDAPSYTATYGKHT